MAKVLLVEDDAEESRMYQKLFSLEGFEVTAIDNGQDCRAKAIEVKPDVILMDIMMPKMNGFETLDVLRFDAETRKIPVIMLTNLSDADTKEDCMKRGAVKYIVKSQMEPKKLVETVREVVTSLAPKAV